jgi:hypothetical protein
MRVIFINLRRRRHATSRWPSTTIWPTSSRGSSERPTPSHAHIAAKTLSKLRCAAQSALGVREVWYWDGRSQLKRLGFRRLPAHGAIPSASIRAETQRRHPMLASCCSTSLCGTCRCCHYHIDLHVNWRSLPFTLPRATELTIHPSP